MKLGELNNPLGLIQEEEWTFITLNCHDFDFVECGIAKKLVPFESKEGCTRKVSEDIAAKFYHYIEEILPFWKLQSEKYVRDSYQEIISFLYNSIYSAPIGQRLDPQGKVKASGF